MPHADYNKKLEYMRLRSQQPGFKEKRRERINRGSRGNKEHLWTNYRLRPADLERMFATQSGRCKCCGDEISLIVGSSNYRQVDHDHKKRKEEPGFVRGLVCMWCNHTFGSAKDSPERCRKAAEYLEIANATTNITNSVAN